MIFALWDASLIGPKAIAGRVGLAKSTVQRIVKDSGRARTPEEIMELSRRGATAGASAQSALGEHNRVMVMKLLGEDYTPKQVAGLVGLTLSHVYSIRRKAQEAKA